MIKNTRLFFVIFVLAVALFAATACHAEKSQIRYSEEFPPPHEVAAEEVTAIREDWLNQDMEVVFFYAISSFYGERFERADENDDNDED
jgi:hypothetical protein